MTVELKMLAWSVLLGLVYVFVAAGLATAQRGLQWNAGNRDGEVKPLTGAAARAKIAAAARADRASRNFLETFVFFAAAALAVVIAGQNTPHTALGAQVYFWARVAYLPVYIIGIPYVRTLIWITALWGFLQVLEALL